MRKTIALMLTLCLAICTIPVQALANDVTRNDTKRSNHFKTIHKELENIVGKKNLTDDLVSIVRNELADFESVGIECEMLIPVEVSDTDEVTYEIQLTEDVVNYVTVEEDKDGLILNFYEDDIHNELIFLNDGELMLDGEIVYISSEIEYTEDVFINNRTTSYANARASSYSLNPHKALSTYTISKGSYKGNQVSWGVSTAASLTTGAFASIVAAAFSIFSVGGGVVLGVVTGLATSMVTDVKIYGMKDAFWSYNFTVKESTYNDALERYLSYDGACYSQRNQLGTKFSHKFYEYNYFYIN